MKLSELVSDLEGLNIIINGRGVPSGSALLDEISEINIKSVVTDSRRAENGSLMICIDGVKCDGNDYAADAIKGGAIALVTEQAEKLCRLCPKDTVIIETDNARRACSYIYDKWYGKPSKRLKFIAVTGTNGKTSVTFMLKSIFESAFIKCGLIGTVRCYSDKRVLNYISHDPSAAMTTPDPEQLYALLKDMADDGVEYVFLEATSHSLALEKLAPIMFEAAVFTNLTPDHLDFHKNMENYFSAKAKLFRRCRLAVINADDKYAARLRSEVLSEGQCRGVSCSTKYSFSDYYASDTVNKGVNGCEYKLISRGLLMNIQCRIPGSFTVMNSLEAAAVAIEVGISPVTVHDALAALVGIDGRMESVSLCPGANFSVFIDYAHTPDALENLLLTVRGFRRKGQRIVLLFGCGGDRDKSKRAVMGDIAARLADKVIVTSDNCRTEPPEKIIDDILKGIGRDVSYTVIPDRKCAIEYAIKEARYGDIILLAGKGHETYEITAAGKRPFNEKEIASEAAIRYYSAGGR